MNKSIIKEVSLLDLVKTNETILMGEFSINRKSTTKNYILVNMYYLQINEVI